MVQRNLDSWFQRLNFWALCHSFRYGCGIAFVVWKYWNAYRSWKCIGRILGMVWSVRDWQVWEVFPQCSRCVVVLVDLHSPHLHLISRLWCMLFTSCCLRFRRFRLFRSNIQALEQVQKLVARPGPSSSHRTLPAPSTPIPSPFPYHHAQLPATMSSCPLSNNPYAALATPQPNYYQLFQMQTHHLFISLFLIIIPLIPPRLLLLFVVFNLVIVNLGLHCLQAKVSLGLRESDHVDYIS